MTCCGRHYKALAMTLGCACCLPLLCRETCSFECYINFLVPYVQVGRSWKGPGKCSTPWRLLVVA